MAHPDDHILDHADVTLAPADIGTWTVDLRSGAVWWDEAAIRLLGVEASPTLAAIERASHVDDRERVVSFFQSVPSRPNGQAVEFRIIRADGMIHWLECISCPIKNEETGTHYVGGVIRDVTERIYSEAALRQSKELLDAVIEAMPDGVFLKDYTKGGRYVLVNTAAERLIGRSAQEILGRTDNEIFPTDTADLYAEEDRIVIEGHKPQITMEQSFSSPAGQRFIEVRKLAIREAGSHLFHVLGVVRDRTEQRQLEEQLRQMQRMDAVGKLTGGVAHDFNNLLAIIMGYGELIREHVGDRADLAAASERMLEATQRGADLVRRLLAFARKQRLEPRAVDLNERLPNIVNLLQRTLGENINIHLIRSPDLWPALIDPNQFDDALVNLAINARDAMPNGGTLTIETLNSHLDADYTSQHVDVRPGDYVMVAVSDTGIGMSPEVIARACEPFFTTKEQGRGTGLGLSMVYGFIKQSGGHVGIYSEVGRGTTIKLYLPRAGVQMEAVGQAQAIPELPGGRESILLVEDNEGVRQIAALQLRDLGYQVIEAENASQALALLDSGVSVDLLFTDIMMPGGMTGYDLVDKARQLYPNLKFLFASGFTDLAARGICAYPPNVELLSKPYRRHELARAVRASLDRAE